MDPQALYRSPNALAPNYSLFRVAERCLLTGHSHQAWPDRSLDGQRQAWLDAAEMVDEKWDRAFDMAGRVRQGYRRLLVSDWTLDYGLAAPIGRALVALNELPTE